jgi:phosphoribosylamine--glycine ligase
VPIAPGDIQALLAFAGNRDIGLTIVGPESALAAGIVDQFQAAGRPIFGPTQAAARLETSKAFAKAFMDAHGIPTAAARSFTAYDAARDYLARHDGPVVVKASGLAAGKGVIVCDDSAAAAKAVEAIMVGRRFGPAGDVLLIEERLEGPELSVLAFSDGRTLALMPAARDHKRVHDGDRGPNTGGMGAYAPVPDVDAALLAEVKRTVLEPALAGMAAEVTPYVGVLYAGLMLTGDGPKVLEFNCRFGDPETQAILPLLDGDLVEVMLACVGGRLDEVAVGWRPGACATVVMASEGYPDAYPAGRPIAGLAEAEALDGVVVFHAGSTRQGDRIVTSGGRVLAVSGLGPDLPAAVERAYAAVGRVGFKGAHYRQDIGVKREA